MRTAQEATHTTFRCESAGCPRSAVWILFPEDERDVPSYLCASHWKQLNLRYPHAADRYIAIELRRQAA